MKRYAFGAAALMLLVAGGVGYAAIPSSESAVISGCYERNTGLLRVIDAQAGKTCTKWEVPISWSQNGTERRSGVAGARRPAGREGRFRERPARRATAGRGQGVPGVQGERGLAQRRAG